MLVQELAKKANISSYLMRSYTCSGPALRTASTLVLLFSVAVSGGCAVKPVEIALPDDHPANPQAQEAPFRPPPDLFAEPTAAPAPEQPAREHHHHSSH